MAQSRIATLLLKLNADVTGLSGPLKQMSREISDAARKSQSAFAGFNTLGSSLSNAGLRLSASITAPLVGVAGAALAAAGKLEQTQTAFTTLTGSATRAKAILEGIRQFADRTPFEFPDLARAGQRMIAFGFDAGRVVPILNSVGNAVASVGGGADELNRVTKALGDIQAKGKLSTQEINQFAEVGLGVREILTKELKITEAQLVSLTEKGAIPAKVAIDAILKGFEGGKFAGAIDAQSKTLLGIFSTLKDQATSTLVDIGTALVPVARRIIEEFVKPTLEGLRSLAKGFAELPAATQNGLLAFAGVTAAVGPTVFIFGQLAQSLVSVIGLYRQLAAVNWALVLPRVGLVGAIAAELGYAAYVGKQVSDSQKEQEKATRSYQDTLDLLRIRLRQAGVDISQLSEQYRKGWITFDEYRNALLRLAREEGDKKLRGLKFEGAEKATSDLDKFKASLAGVSQQAAAVEAIKLPEWMERITQNGLAAVAALNNLAGGFADQSLKVAVLEEVSRRDETARRKSVEAITDFLTAGQAWGQKLELHAAQISEIAVASTSAKIAMDAYTEGVNRNRSVTAAAAVSAQLFKTKLEDFGIRSASTARKELEDLNRVIDDLFRQRSGAIGGDQAAINSDINAALEKRKQLQIELGEVSRESGQRQRESLIEVSTITTNLSQSLARLIFDGGKFGETMIKVFKQIGESITANVLQKLIQSSGVVDAIGKGLGSILKNIPGLGKLGGVIGGGGSAAGGVLGGGGSAGAAAAQAISGTAMQAVSAITGVVSAVTGVIGVFQTAGTNRRLSNLNQTATGQLNQAISQQETFNLYLPSLPQIHDRLKQIIQNGIGVYSQPSSVVRVLVEQFMQGVQVSDAARLQIIADRLAPLSGMADRLHEIVQVGLPVYNAPGSQFQIAGFSGFEAAGGGGGVLRVEGAVIGGPFADATIDWLTDRIAERLQRRGVKVG